MAERPVTDLAEELTARVRAAPDHSVPALRSLRLEYTAILRDVSADDMLELALLLVEQGRIHRWVPYELLFYHNDGMAALTPAILEMLGEGFSAWDEVDPFGCYLSGPAWRNGLIDDGDVHRWAASPDRWWRRAALVSTVPLNLTARGGTGDTARTLATCDLLLTDRDDMVVKAMSWALRALAGKDPAAVRRYLAAHKAVLAPRVIREVGNKLNTGLKSGGRRV